jgi:TolA-binding protein
VTEPVRYTSSKGVKGDLLASAKTDAAPPGARRRALVVAAAAAATSTAATSATAGLGTLARVAVWKWVVIGAVGLGTVVAAKAVVAPAGSADAGTDQRTPAPVPPPAVPQPRRDVPAILAPLPGASSVAAAPSAPTPSPSAATAPADRTAPPRPLSPPASSNEVATPRSPRPPPSTLAAEIASIDGAKQALAHGDSGEALRQLDGYQSAFPRGRLAAEATALRVEALVRAGRRDDARAELARLRAASPDSPLLENLTSLVGE